MTGRVLILGGYGNFGKRIARALTLRGIPVILAGRSEVAARRFCETLPAHMAQIEIFDVTTGLDRVLKKLKPAVVINTCGPFQNRDYDVAETCIRNGIHSLDLADGREFVCGIRQLHAAAVGAGVTVVSGASTVPGLSSAVVEHYADEFSEISSLRYGISPGQKAERGLATTQSIMSYVGRPLKSFPGPKARSYGWQDLYRQTYPVIGRRWMANCDVPDLDLLPEHYRIRSIQFSAGVEFGFMHLGLWGLSWLVRLGVPLDLPAQAGRLLNISDWFDRFGTSDSGMHILLSGKDRQGKPRQRRWFIIARGGDGPQIPTIPAILLAERLARGTPMPVGSMPCLGLVALPDYLDALKAFRIEVHTNAS